MDHNADGTYTSQQYAIQSVLGYGDNVDDLFHAVSEMDKVKIVFSYGGIMYVVWAWKGDYAQLGAGNEVGFYKQLDILGMGDEEGHFYADPFGYNPKMSVSLSIRGEGEVAAFAPEDPYFWPAAFNPAHQDVHLWEMTSTVSVDFSDAPDGMGGAGFYDAFATAVESRTDLDNVTFNWDQKNKKVTFTYRRRRKKSTPALRFRARRGAL